MIYKNMVNNLNDYCKPLLTNIHSVKLIRIGQTLSERERVENIHVDSYSFDISDVFESVCVVYFYLYLLLDDRKKTE